MMAVWGRLAVRDILDRRARKALRGPSFLIDGRRDSLCSFFSSFSHASATRSSVFKYCMIWLFMFSCLVEERGGGGGVCAVVEGTGGTSGTDDSWIAREDLDCSDEAPRDRGVVPDENVLIRPCVSMLLSLAARLGRTDMESFLLKILGVLEPVELPPEFAVYVVPLADRAQLDSLADVVAAGAVVALLSDALAALRFGTLFCVVILRPPARLERVDECPGPPNPGSCGSGFSDGPFSKSRSFSDFVGGRLLDVLANEDVSFLLATPTRRCISITATPSWPSADSRAVPLLRSLDSATFQPSMLAAIAS